MNKNLATNKKANYNYIILEKIEAGLKLTGPEVKSIRNHQINLDNAYISFQNNEVFLINAHISKYKSANNLTDYNPERKRKLLLKKKEIAYLRAKANEKGLTIIPLSVYNKGRYLKIEIALVKGKKTFDKRQSIKDRTIKRELQRKLKNYY